MQTIIDWVMSPKPYVCLAILIVTLVIWVALRRFVRKIIGQNGKKDTFASLMLNIVRYMLIVICILLILQVNGINVSSAVAGLGIVGAIVGLALQDALKDIIMGVNILSESFYRVGDIVEIQGYSGRVTHMTLKSTRLTNREDGYEVRICNRNIDRVKVLGETSVIDIPLSYEEDPQKIKDVFDEIISVVSEWKECKKAEFLGLQAYESSAILYRIRLQSAPSDRLTLRRRVYQEVDKTLRKNNMTVPYMQVDVHHIGKE